MDNVVGFLPVAIGTVAQGHPDGGVEATGPTLAEQMDIISLSARIALTEAIRSRDIMPDAVRAEAGNYASDVAEERETLLSGLTERYGAGIVEQMMMMQFATLARAVARAIELRFDGE